MLSILLYKSHKSHYPSASFTFSLPEETTWSCTASAILFTFLHLLAAFQGKSKGLFEIVAMKIVGYVVTQIICTAIYATMLRSFEANSKLCNMLLQSLLRRKSSLIILPWNITFISYRKIEISVNISLGNLIQSFFKTDRYLERRLWPYKSLGDFSLSGCSWLQADRRSKYLSYRSLFDSNCINLGCLTSLNLKRMHMNSDETCDVKRGKLCTLNFTKRVHR